MGEKLKIGELLKQKRIELGFSIDDVSNATKISKRILTAVEDGRIEELPAAIYVRGYIKSYGRFLKLDEKFIIDEALKNFPFEENRNIPNKRYKNKNIFKSMALTVTAILVLLLFFIVKEFIPPHFITAEKKNAPQIFTKKLEEQGKRKEEKSEFIAGSESIQKNGPLALKDAYAQHEKKYRLEVKATELTWVRNKIDSDIIKEALLKKGDTITFEGNEKFELTIGNAGGVSMLLNGKPVESPGKSGEVKRITLP